jgi:TPR repeat protein
VAIALQQEGDHHGAERHLRCAAGGGSAEAAFRLGALLDSRARERDGEDSSPESGMGGAPIGDEAAEWYERAAGQGHARAQVRLGMTAAQRGDVELAAHWYRLAAEAGSRNGAFNLGLLLAREGSEPEAALWWTRAADAGHGRAALRLALLSARRGQLDDARGWCDRAVACGPAEVAERAARLTAAVDQELSA